MNSYHLLGELGKSAARGDQAAALLKAIKTRATLGGGGRGSILASDALAGGVNELANKVSLDYLPDYTRYSSLGRGRDSFRALPADAAGILTGAAGSAGKGSPESGIIAQLIKNWRGGKAAQGLAGATPHPPATGSGLLQGINPRVRP